MMGPGADRDRDRDDRRASAGERPAEPRHDEEMVDEAGDESFPASDPPSWEPLHSGAPKRNIPQRGAPNPGAANPGAPARDAAPASDDDDDDRDMSARLGGAEFGAHLAGLEERVAAADARGEAVPAEARAMIAHLREIVDALDGLTAALGRRPASGGAPPAAGTTDAEAPRP